MTSLLSETSSVQTRHTELATIIGETPLVECESLKLLAGRAIAGYFSAESPAQEIRDEVIGATRGVVSATRAVYDALRDDEVDDEQFEAPDVSKHFPGLHLELGCEKHRAVDVALQGILDSLSPISRFAVANTKTYLFRIATHDPDYNLIAELNRKRHNVSSWQSPTSRHAAVDYQLSFAGYEIER